MIISYCFTSSRMLPLFSVLSLSNLIVIADVTCVDLAGGGKLANERILTIPEGYSLRDVLTVRGHILEDSPISWTRYSFLIFKTKQNLITARTLLSKKLGYFAVRQFKTSSGTNILQITGTKEDDGSLLIQMRCNKMTTTCLVTSQGNRTVIPFNYHETLPDILSTNSIVIGSEVDQLVTLRSIAICKGTKPRVETELKLGSPPGDDPTRVKLICRVTGLPVLTAEWIKDGEKITRDTATELEQSHNEQTLTLIYTLDGIGSGDTGIYLCRGRSLLLRGGGVMRKLNLDKESIANLNSSSGNLGSGHDDCGHGVIADGLSDGVETPETCSNCQKNKEGK